MPHNNGVHRILVGAATTMVAVVIIGGVVMYADVQQIKGNRYTVADARETEMQLRQEFNGTHGEIELRLRTEWLEGLSRIEAKIDELRALHMEVR